jgi:hypothetical protein
MHTAQIDNSKCTPVENTSVKFTNLSGAGRLALLPEERSLLREGRPTRRGTDMRRVVLK